MSFNIHVDIASSSDEESAESTIFLLISSSVTSANLTNSDIHCASRNLAIKVSSDFVYRTSKKVNKYICLAKIRITRRCRAKVFSMKKVVHMAKTSFGFVSILLNFARPNPHLCSPVHTHKLVPL